QLGSSGNYTPWGSGAYDQIRTIAGNGNFGSSGDGSAAVSAAVAPYAVAVDTNGTFFLADANHNRIRRVDAATGLITTVAGSGSGGYGGDGGTATSAFLSSPESLALDNAGNLYIADSANLRIRRVDATTGIITTVAGTGTSGFSGDAGLATAAKLNNPS